MVVYNTSRTIEEMVDYILENGGPDENRRAHPINKKLEYTDLQEALSIVHRENPRLQHIQPYHFKNVNHIWQGEDGQKNAREVTGQLIQTLQNRNNWSLIDIIKNISKNYFDNEPIKINTSHGILTYNASSPLQVVFDHSPSTAILDWIKHNESPEIREGYKNIRPWHFDMTQMNTWNGKNGVEYGREITGELIKTLQERYDWTLKDIILNITEKYFHKEPIELETPDGIMTYTAAKAFYKIYRSSPSTAILDWINHNDDPEIREGYKNIRPWHFSKSPLSTWEGKEGKKRARELTGELVQTLQERYGWLLTDIIQNINLDTYHNEPLEIITPDGILTYTASRPISRVCKNSPSAAILDWINHNNDPEIREGYKNIRPWHFSKSPMNALKKEENKKEARKVTGELINTLQRKRGWNLAQVIMNIKAKDFHTEPLELETPDGKIMYTAGKVLYTTYKNSPSAAVIDWINNHENPLIRNGLKRVKPWYFNQSPKNIWRINNGRNAREVISEFVAYSKLNNNSNSSRTKNHKDKIVVIPTIFGDITYSIQSPLNLVYKGSLRRAFEDIQKNKDTILPNKFIPTPKTLEEILALTDEQVLSIHSLSFKYMEDEALVFRAKKELNYNSKQKEACDYLITKYRKKLERPYIKKYFFKGQEPDDVIAKAENGLYEAIGDFNFDEGVSFRTFANTCALREVISEVKITSGHKQRIFNEAYSLDQNIYEDLEDKRFTDPYKIVSARESVTKINYFLKEVLSEFEFKVSKYHIKGYSYLEIAEKLHCIPKKVDNALCRVKRKVNRALQNGELTIN